MIAHFQLILCKFYYSDDLKCYSQHFVYDLVYYDTINILYFVKDLAHINEECMIELKTSINTLSYVLNHMIYELSQIKNLSSYKEC